MHLLEMLVVIMGENVVDGEVVGRNCLTAAKSAVPLMAAVWGKIVARKGWDWLSGELMEVFATPSPSGGG